MQLGRIKADGIVLFQITDSLLRELPRRHCFNQYRFSRSDKGDMEDGIYTTVTEIFKELSKGNVIIATQIIGEEMQRDGFRHHLADGTQYSKGHYTGKLELLLP